MFSAAVSQPSLRLVSGTGGMGLVVPVSAEQPAGMVASAVLMSVGSHAAAASSAAWVAALTLLVTVTVVVTGRPSGPMTVWVIVCGTCGSAAVAAVIGLPSAVQAVVVVASGSTPGTFCWSVGYSVGTGLSVAYGKSVRSAEPAASTAA